MYPALRSLSLRLALLLPSLWRLLVRLNFTLPVAVKEKRFAAAFFVFSFILFLAAETLAFAKEEPRLL